MIKIVTDSGVSLPPSVIQEFDIRLVTGTIQIGSEIIRDYPLSIEDLFKQITASKEAPVGRDSVVKDFSDVYQKLIDEVPDKLQILSLHVSEALATTHTMARNAAIAMKQADIRVFDTRNVSAGEGLMVHEAAQMAKAGKDVWQIEEQLESMALRLKFFMLVDTLDYLAKGGRIGSVQHRVGTLLNVKPVLTVSNGTVNPSGQHRSRERGMQALRDLITNDVRGKQHVRLAITHALAPADAEALGNQLCDQLKPETYLMTELSASVGMHTGPGAVGIAWYAE